MTNLLLLLLPLAALSGWYAAKRSHSTSEHSEEGRFTRDYLLGLNYLLNEQPDKAVDIFIKMIEVDSETVETHLALGALFRRRGEVERAIRIHQNLIARPHLPKQHRTEALFALGQDYLRAGVLDRAERVFSEMINEESMETSHALHYLLDIYQQQKRWESAIAIAQKLLPTCKEMAAPIAHYYCELAVTAQQKNQLDEARNYLKQALTVDPQCVRASLLTGDIEYKIGRTNAAIAAYQHVIEQDPDYLVESIAPLIACYEALGDKVALQTYLHECHNKYPRVSLLLAIVNQIKSNEGETAAIEYLADQLHQRPSLRGLQPLIALHLQTAEGVARENLLTLHELVNGLLKNKPIYRCVQCGFSTRILNWLCPSCKHWSSNKPIQGLEGE